MFTLSHFSRVQFFVTAWTVARQASLSMGFSRQAYWSGLPCPPPGDLPNPGIEPVSLMSPALAGGFFTTSDHLYLVEKPVNSQNFGNPTQKGDLTLFRNLQSSAVLVIIVGMGVTREFSKKPVRKET